MNLNEFLWHAKRGHGECLLVLKESNISYYKNCVKKVFLNNYAFLEKDEYRSSYACELVAFYNDDEYFLNLLWNKIKRTNFENYFTFDYLINNLYFIIEKNKKHNFEMKITKLLIKNLDKDYFSINENNSICSLISLMIDLNIDKTIKKIIVQHYNNFKNSNLDLSDIKHYYCIDLPNNKCNYKFLNEEILKDFNALLEYISDEIAFNKNMSFLSKYICSDYLELLLNMLEEDNIDNSFKTNILKIVLYNGDLKVNNLSKIIDFLDKSTHEQKNIICEILKKAKSAKLLSILRNKNLEDSFLIRLILNNYNENMYELVHKKLLKLEINYHNSNNWFEVENELINYFKKKIIDDRLLIDLKRFFKEGLSSNSRYKIVLILKKYNMLDNKEIESLRYDANYKIRQKFKNYKKH